jgi:hypothetical protein
MLRAYSGHAHFLERALSRRKLLGATALAMGASLAWPASGFAESEESEKQVNPNPIPGGTDVSQFIGGPPRIFHFFAPAIGQEVSTITDLDGSVAAGEVQGTGLTNTGTKLFFDADMRFMSGKYVGVDGRTREGTFGFV